MLKNTTSAVSSSAVIGSGLNLTNLGTPSYIYLPASTLPTLETGDWSWVSKEGEHSRREHTAEDAWDVEVAL